MGIKQQIVEEGGQVLNVWGQPSAERRAVLEDNRAVRNSRGARRMDWAQPHLRIPELDLVKLKMANPDLGSPDGAIRRAAWVRFFNSPESLPYRVREKNGGASARSYLGGRQ